jgi:RNA polymerase sigma-70 factor (ECF subfamily)
MSPGEASDEELFQRVGGGDRVAFGLLVRRHHDRMVRFAWRLAGERARAEDIVQEAFTRAWVKAPGWRPPGEGGTGIGAGTGRFTTWLSRIVLNLAIDGRRRATPVALEDAGDIASDEPSADVATERRERDVAVRRAIADLPERQRAAILLTYDEGLSNNQAAEALGTSVGALELLLVRARRTLREALQTYVRDDT